MMRGPVAVLLIVLAVVPRAVEASGDAATKRGNRASVDWTSGSFAWRDARRASVAKESELWDRLNVCDSDAVTSSAPLTVLFGISEFWKDIQKRRAKKGREGTLEVHVVGASYPFEGRADWSLLASRRPADVPGVRLVLVLGTPWQDDNLPQLKEHKGEAVLLQVGAQKSPIGGHWSDGKGHVICDDKRELSRSDKDFSRESLCRDHGNGLEVVCVEKLYQDANLPEPDAVALFSPGFPQITRRTWDTVLVDLLQKDIVTFVSDEISGESAESVFMQNSRSVKPGGVWNVKGSPGEDSITLLTMHSYGARRLGSRRNPFPIILADSGETMVKNAVLQTFAGFKLHSQVGAPLSAEVVKAEQHAVESFHWKHIDQGSDLRRALLTPTSPAFEKATRAMYVSSLRDIVQEKGLKSFSATQRKELKRLGLAGGKGKAPVRWGPMEWLFLIENLDASEIL